MITLESIKQKLAPPLEVMPVGYMEFNIHDFDMFPGFEDSAEWFYQNRFVRLFDNMSVAEVAKSILMQYRLTQDAVKCLSDDECAFLKRKLWWPLLQRDNVVLGYGEPVGYTRDGFRFLKVALKSELR